MDNDSGTKGDSNLSGLLPVTTWAWGRVTATARWLYEFIRLLANRARAHHLTDNAATLTFATLLSLVPLMTVALAIFAAFPIGDRVAQSIQDFLFANFVPASGEVMQAYILQFSAKASRLSGLGFALLVVVALMMMGNIDRALNKIWETRRNRSPLGRFLLYWAILSLGPVLIGASVAVTSYLMSLPLLSQASESAEGRQLLGLTPILFSALAYTLLYVLVPNRRVPLGDALLGGVLAAVLFEASKHAFGLYVTSFPSYEAIYGALAAIPIFLLWVYLSWMVLLVGAEFTHCLSVFRGGRADTRLDLVGVIRVLAELAARRPKGEAMSVRALVRRGAVPGSYRCERTLEALSELGLVHHTTGDRWVAVRGLHEIPVYELLRSNLFEPPRDDPEATALERRIAEMAAKSEADAARDLSLTLDQLLETPSEPVPFRKRTDS